MSNGNQTDCRNGGQNTGRPVSQSASELETNEERTVRVFKLQNRRRESSDWRWSFSGKDDPKQIAIVQALEGVFAKLRWLETDGDYLKSTSVTAFGTFGSELLNRRSMILVTGCRFISKGWLPARLLRQHL